MARSWWNWAADARLQVASLAIVVGMLAGCGDRGPEDPAASGRGTAAGPLPVPAGTSGGSVTGMPTSPPPGSEVEVIDAPVTDAGAESPADALPPEDPNAIPVDPATGLAVGAPAPAVQAPAGTPADPAAQPGETAAAGAVVREYAAALASGAFAAAQQLWSATPTDSALLRLARGPAFAVDVLAPARSADPAAAGVVTVPVRVRGTAEDGSPRSISALYTVRRNAEGQWRIASATVREESP